MGKHCLLDLYGCPFSLLNDVDFIISILTEAAGICGATILNTASHKFEPYGVTAILLLSESHLSIHTWPEEGKAAADCYTCGESNPLLGCDFLIKKLEATNHKLTYIER